MTAAIDNCCNLFRYKITPQCDLNFGPLAYGFRKSQSFTLENTGALETRFKISMAAPAAPGWVNATRSVEGNAPLNPLLAVLLMLMGASYRSGGFCDFRKKTPPEKPERTAGGKARRESVPKESRSVQVRHDLPVD